MPASALHLRLAVALAMVTIALARPAPRAGGNEHTVLVGNNFFSPENLVIEAGDAVRWNNGFGTHNVYSCIPEQIGCEGETAAESFSSGPALPGPWTFRYTFTQPGRNRYLCQPHAAFMWGTVTVVGTPAAVPDGRGGAPLRVDRIDPASAALSVSWDVSTCGLNPDHQLVWGEDSGLPAGPEEPYTIAGSSCGLGADPPFDWTDAPTPATGRFVWWLVIATDGGETEGSWGTSSYGERHGSGPGGASATCDIAVKDTANPCGS